MSGSHLRDEDRVFSCQDDAPGTPSNFEVLGGLLCVPNVAPKIGASTPNTAVNAVKHPEQYPKRPEPKHHRNYPKPLAQVCMAIVVGAKRIHRLADGFGVLAIYPLSLLLVHTLESTVFAKYETTTVVA